MTHFFTSDLHIGHKNVIQYTQRPFEDLDHMHAVIIDNWNKLITDDDHVWIIGDLSLSNIETTLSVLQELKGKKHLIRGNHDDKLKVPVESLLVSVDDYKELLFPDSTLPRGIQGVILFHYPIESWNKWYHGSWHLHGHIHCIDPIGRLENDSKRKKMRLDVGMDGHDFTPWTFDEIKTLMEKYKP